MQSAAPIFDCKNNLEGRGFYLCPDAGCFSAVHRNKKIRTIYFPKRENLEEVKREVLEAILKIIKKDLNLCKNMGYSFNTSREERSIHEDEHILLWCDNLPEEKVTMRTAACALKSKIFSQKKDLENHGKGCIVNHKYPIVSRLMVNLQKYEMLSSKGPAL
jgi:predicted RNA-binding protein YlxR (DUF448 family)